MINNAVMQFVDRAYLAHSSMNALEAVLPAGMLMWIFAGFFQSVVGYSSVLVGQYYGAGMRGKCRETYHVAMAFAVVFGILSVPLVPFGNWILTLTASSERLLADEKSYFSLLMLGGFAVYVQMAAASYFTGQGRTRIVFWVNLIGNVLNVALDPVLIFGWFGCPQLGIAGAAYATVFSMVVQCVVLVAAVWRAPDATTRIDPSDRSIVFTLLRFGVPSGLYTILNTLSFTVFVFVTGGVGSLELAVSNACFTVNYLLFAPMEGFSIGASTLVAQAIGRGDLVLMAGDRVSAGSGKTLTHDFLGCPCRWPKGVFAFAQLMEAPVFFVTCVRMGWNAYEARFRLFAGTSGARGAAVRAALLDQYVGFLQEETREHPEQWYQFYDFFGEFVV